MVATISGAEKSAVVSRSRAWPWYFRNRKLAASTILLTRCSISGIGAPMPVNNRWARSTVSRDIHSASHTGMPPRAAELKHAANPYQPPTTVSPTSTRHASSGRSPQKQKLHAVSNMIMLTSRANVPADPKATSTSSMPAANRASISPAMRASVSSRIVTSRAAAATYLVPSRTEPGMVTAARSTGRPYASGEATAAGRRPSIESGSIVDGVERNHRAGSRTRTDQRHAGAAFDPISAFPVHRTDTGRGAMGHPRRRRSRPDRRQPAILGMGGSDRSIDQGADRGLVPRGLAGGLRRSARRDPQRPSLIDGVEWAVFPGRGVSGRAPGGCAGVGVPGAAAGGRGHQPTVGFLDLWRRAAAHPGSPGLRRRYHPDLPVRRSRG